MRCLLTVFLCLICSPAGAAQSPVGDWTTVDDNTGEARSVIRIEDDGGRLVGRVVELIDPDEPNPLCDQCKGDRHMQPILGMEILWDMTSDGEVWSGGRILDPENGKTYRCKLWLEGRDLRVRGYLGPFYRTQTWRRANDSTKN